MIHFSPVRLGGIRPLNPADRVAVTLGDAPELARLLECSARVPTLSVTLGWPLCDTRPLSAMLRGFDSLGLDAQEVAIHHAPLMAEHCVEVACALMPVWSSAGRLRPESPPSRDYWQSSAGAWMADEFERHGEPGVFVSIGWPMPLRSALVQLLKQTYVDTMEGLPPVVFEAFRNGLFGYEPGAVLIKPDEGVLPGSMSCSVLAVPDFGLPADTALYAVQSARERLLEARP